MLLIHVSSGRGRPRRRRAVVFAVAEVVRREGMSVYRVERWDAAVVGPVMIKTDWKESVGRREQLAFLSRGSNRKVVCY